MLDAFMPWTVCLKIWEVLAERGVEVVVPSPNDRTLYYGFAPRQESDIWLIELPDEPQ